MSPSSINRWVNAIDPINLKLTAARQHWAERKIRRQLIVNLIWIAIGCAIVVWIWWRVLTR